MKITHEQFRIHEAGRASARAQAAADAASALARELLAMGKTAVARGLQDLDPAEFKAMGAAIRTASFEREQATYAASRKKTQSRMTPLWVANSIKRSLDDGNWGWATTSLTKQQALEAFLDETFRTFQAAANADDSDALYYLTASQHDVSDKEYAAAHRKMTKLATLLVKLHSQWLGQDILRGK